MAVSMDRPGLIEKNRVIGLLSQLTRVGLAGRGRFPRFLTDSTKGNCVRRSFVGIMAAILAVLVLGAGLAGGATPNAKQRVAQRTNARALAAQQATLAAPSKDNFASLTYNHFGNPAKGQVVLETWLATTYDSEDLLPATTTAQARAIAVKGSQPAKRVAFRVTVFTNQGDELSSATVNTNTAGQLTVSAPTITNLRGDSPVCTAYQVVTYSIRWADDTLTSGKTFETPSLWWNDNCYFLE